MPFVQSTYPAQNIEADVYDDGHLRVEHNNYYVLCESRPLKLPRTEFLIISRLTRNPERVILFEDLWRAARGDSKPFNPRSLHVHIYRLRKKLKPYGIRIETMVNVGYRLLPASGKKRKQQDDKST